MPVIMLKHEYWTRLKPILIEVNIYKKANLKNMIRHGIVGDSIFWENKTKKKRNYSQFFINKIQSF